MSTYKQIDKERRFLRGVVAKLQIDLVEEARLLGNERLWNLAGRIEGIMAALGIEREAGARRKV